MSNSSNRSRRTTTRSRADLQTGTVHVIETVQSSLPVRLLAGAVRFRAELTLTVLVAAAWWLVDAYVVAGRWATLTLALIGIALVAVPVSRRYVVRRFLAVLTRHRLRATLLSCGVVTFDGRLPRLLWSRPTPVGERVWLWLRPGLSIAHLERITDVIAAGCIGSEARVCTTRKVVALAMVDVIRRDPLATAGVNSALTADLPAQRTGGQVIPLPDRAAHTAAQPAPSTSSSARTGTEHPAAPTGTSSTTPSAPRSGRGTTTTRRARATDPAPEIAPSVAGIAGEDVSDYV